MLEDDPRTSAYKNAIMNNKPFFKDKIVMDVGCGTGILSIFCAQAGAKVVYAVEASDVANLAKEIVKENKYEDIIQVFVVCLDLINVTYP
jgi:predicted RNA methylase